MAGYLRIALAALEPLPDIVYGLHEEYDDTEFFLKGKTGDLAGPVEQSFNNRTRERLNAMTMGLLEVHVGVDFLHRTLKDFLATGEMMKFLSEKSREGFEPNISIARAYVAWIKRGRFPRSVIRKRTGFYEPNPLVQNVRQALYYVSMGVGQDAADTETLLDELDYTLELMFWNKSPKFEESAAVSKNYRRLFCESVILAELSGYVSAKLKGESTYFDILEISPLQLILEADGPHSSAMIKCILEHGFSPNDHISTAMPDLATTSIWMNLLSGLARNITEQTND
ncbi:hypothetical protein EDB81DRAFT_150317 [Dactylonectria macrodidyma]|uniref:DUF7791 domain-containing protein n=1 Tax=Dactylonectria macrodidyma TaxID=307937 RepID=A0A9P9FQJ8_9HYPO|nr:hypothetical protein EDB81DRAFT_150317 [Dactylonectria macrodidyma]